MNIHSEYPNRENGTTFSEFPFLPGIFQWDEPKKGFKPFTSQQEFTGICGKCKQTLFQLILDTFEVGCIIWTPVSFVFSKLCIGVDLYIKLKHSDPFYIYKRRRRIQTPELRKLRKIFQAPGENQTQDPPSSSSDALTTDIIFLCLISTVH